MIPTILTMDLYIDNSNFWWALTPHELCTTHAFVKDLDGKTQVDFDDKPMRGVTEEKFRINTSADWFKFISILFDFAEFISDNQKQKIEKEYYSVPNWESLPINVQYLLVKTIGSNVANNTGIKVGDWPRMPEPMTYDPWPANSPNAIPFSDGRHRYKQFIQHGASLIPFYSRVLSSGKATQEQRAYLRDNMPQVIRDNYPGYYSLI